MMNFGGCTLIWMMLFTVNELTIGLIIVKYGIRPAKAARTPKFFRLDVRTPCLSLSKTLMLIAWGWAIHKTTTI